MGSGHSKGGGLRRQLRPLVPRAWAELEQLRVRFQQEVRRRRGEPELQHLFTFAVFHAVAGPLCPTLSKSEFLAMFAALDRKRRGRIAAIDFFCGLALVVDAKKAQKLDFMMSLLENGACKALNRCELMIVLSAAARGLAMFTLMPEPHRDAMKPLVRRLMGEDQEVARQSIVDKALVDAEILFFMNDLEGSAGTSEELLGQQARLLSRLALLDLQAARVGIPDDRATSGKVMPLGAVASECDGAPKSRAPASIDVTIRKLQILVCPPQSNTRSTGSSSSSQKMDNVDSAIAAVNPSEIKNYVDARTIQRLVNRITDGSLTISASESERLVSKMAVDQFGLVRCGEVFRAVSTWLHANWQDDQVPFWKQTARFVVDQANSVMAGLNNSLAGVSARVMCSRTLAKASEASNTGSSNVSSVTLMDDANWSVNVRVGQGSNLMQPRMDENLSRMVSTPDNNGAKDTIKFRLGVHPPETAPIDANDPSSEDLDGDDSGARLIVCFTLRDDTSVEDAMDLAAATERFLSHDTVLAAFSDVWLAVRVSVGESTQNDNTGRQSLYKQLRVCLVLTHDWLSEFEDHSTIRFSDCVQQFLVLGETSRSLEDILRSSLRAVGFMSSLTKIESRESLLRYEFERFDSDNSGDWSLEEFNSFQQALGQDSLDEDAVRQIFLTEANGSDAITFDAFASLYKNCSAAEMLALFKQLQVGSLDRLVQGSLSVSCITRLSLLHQITKSMANPSRWGDAWLKLLLFLGQSSSDVSYDLHFSTISDLFGVIGLPSPGFLTDSMFISSCVEKLSALTHPPHQEHARNQQCESLRCSLGQEIDKNVSYPTERDAQSTAGLLALPAREETAIEICLRAVSLAIASVLGPEVIEIRGKRMRIVCELDNLMVRRA